MLRNKAGARTVFLSFITPVLIFFLLLLFKNMSFSNVSFVIDKYVSAKWKSFFGKIDMKIYFQGNKCNVAQIFMSHFFPVRSFFKTRPKEELKFLSPFVRTKRYKSVHDADKISVEGGQSLHSRALMKYEIKFIDYTDTH